MGIITQLCGIAICLVLAGFYKQQRKLNLETQNAFVRVWKMVMLGLILDISSIYILRYEEFFTHTEIELDKVKNLFKTMSCLCPGLTINLTFGEGNGKVETITYYST